jgi:hypothetical protein
MSDSNLKDAAQPEPMPFRRLYLLGWRELFQPRERILRGIYQNTANANNVPLDPTASLDEARQLLAKSLPHIVPDNDFTRDSVESRWAICARLMAAWPVFWFSVFPFAVAGAFLAVRWNQMPVRSVEAVVINVLLAGGIFFVSTIAGLFLCTFSTRPFVAFLNWLLRTRQI